MIERPSAYLRESEYQYLLWKEDELAEETPPGCYSAELEITRERINQLERRRDG